MLAVILCMNKSLLINGYFLIFSFLITERRPYSRRRWLTVSLSFPRIAATTYHSQDKRTYRLPFGKAARASTVLLRSVLLSCPTGQGQRWHLRHRPSFSSLRHSDGKRSLGASLPPLCRAGILHFFRNFSRTFISTALLQTSFCSKKSFNCKSTF